MTSELPASGAPENVEDDEKLLKNAGNTSEHKCECSKPKEEENPPEGPGEEPYDPGGETTAPGAPHDVREGPRNVRKDSECADETDTPCQHRDPGGHFDLQRDSRVAEGGPDHPKVVGDAGYNGEHPRSEENKCGVNMNALR